MNLNQITCAGLSIMFMIGCSNLNQFGTSGKSNRSAKKNPPAKESAEADTDLDQDDNDDQDLVKQPNQQISSSEDRLGSNAGYSLKAQVRLKKPEMIQNTLAAALDLTPANVCKELGQLSCTASVHKVLLGGTDAYNKAIYAPAPDIGVTAPMAGDRIVLTACSQRVASDFANLASAVIFKNLTVSANGEISNIDSPEVKAAITEIYRRGLQRNPVAEEIVTIQSFHQELVAAGSKQAGKDWATLSCFAVMSSIEAFFY